MDRKKKRDVPSIFHIVINSNKTVGQLSHLTDEQIIQFDNKLKDIAKGFKAGMRTRFRKVGFENRLVDFECYQEVGPKKKMIHLDIVCEYNKYTHLNFKAIREWLKEQFGYKCHFNVEAIGNNKVMISNYASKDRVKLV